MQTTQQDVESAMSEIIEALDSVVQVTSSSSSQRRAESRRHLRASCGLWLYDDQSPTKTGDNFVTRNLSFRGLSVVGSLSKPIRAGQPIEVVIAMPDTKSSHVAGTVAFCRGVGQECFEVGLNVEAVGADWIIARDLESAKKRYEWFAAALDVGTA